MRGRLGKSEGARAQWQASYDMWKRGRPDPNSAHLIVALNGGNLALMRGDVIDAERLLREAQALDATLTEVFPMVRANVHRLDARVAMAQGRRADAAAGVRPRDRDAGRAVSSVHRIWPKSGSSAWTPSVTAVESRAGWPLPRRWRPNLPSHPSRRRLDELRAPALTPRTRQDASVDGTIGAFGSAPAPPSSCFQTTAPMTKPTRRDLANASASLAADAVKPPRGGQPGHAEGMADIAEVLVEHFYSHNPTIRRVQPRSFRAVERPRFRCCTTRCCIWTGYDLPMEQLRRFRQLHSKTAGHPEASETPGVETTTGPLGQGLANAVGFALAEKVLAHRFNRPEFSVVDHFTWVLLGDGCLMEGISHEVCSLAGTWKLGKLIALYDDNGISIDGNVLGWFTDDSRSASKLRWQ